MKRTRTISFYEMLKSGIHIVIVLLLVSSCNKEQAKPLESDPIQIDKENLELSDLKCASQPGHLVDFKFLSHYTLEEIIALGQVFEPILHYGVSTYKISYLTKYKGKIIKASGAVCIPDLENNKRAPMVLYVHGTKFSDGDFIPSSGMDASTIFTAANGLICFAPDYIGLGDSKEIFHPYLINEPSNDAICDMMLAGRQFLFMKKIMPKFKLFMFGFSEGGFNTMAAQRFIENDPYYKHRIHLTAVAAGMGPYDLNNLCIQPIVAGETYPGPSFLLFGMIAYNEYYGLGKDLDEMFKNSYGQQFLDLLKQNKGYVEINPQFPQTIADLLQDDFRKTIADGTSAFNIAFDKNNTINNWIPRTPMRIYHSPADEIVPFINAQTAYDAFVAVGASSVELIPLPPVSHEISAAYAVFDLLPWFGSF